LAKTGAENMSTVKRAKVQYTVKDAAVKKKETI